MNGLESQKGDVYSYGIILQEIALRGPPYCHSREGTQGKFLNDVKNIYQ